MKKQQIRETIPVVSVPRDLWDSMSDLCLAAKSFVELADKAQQVLVIPGVLVVDYPVRLAESVDRFLAEIEKIEESDHVGDRHK